MRYRLMDILACPICKAFPLELLVFEATKGEQKHRDKVGCEIYCVYNGGPTDHMDKTELVRDCEICFSYDLREALLTCKKCGRWYPVMDSIPHMLPDDLRKEAEDRQFLVRHAEKVPERVKKEGLPFHL
jgi:uncharacterized protein YbaR (Trm112 family)